MKIFFIFTHHNNKDVHLTLKEKKSGELKNTEGVQ